METVEEKTKMLNVMDVVLIPMDDENEIMFSKIFEWSNDSGIRIGKLNIWNKHAPFSVVFHKNMQISFKKKGFHGCYYIPNLFEYTYDKRNKLLLKCVEKIGNNNNKQYCMLKYHKTSSINELRQLVTLKQNGHEIYGGPPDIYGKISPVSEAFEILKL